MTQSQAAPQTGLLRITLIGLAAGLLSGLFGVGGGILIAPALVLLARMDQRISHGTSLAAVLPISASSLVTYWTHDHVDWRVAACLAVGAVLGALVGTRLLHVLPHRTLAISFATLLVVTAIRLFLPLHATARGTLSLVEVLVLGFIGFSAGTLAGLLGVGGGVVMVPAMMMYLHIPAVIAKGTSVAVIIPTSIIGTWRNRRNKNADLRVAGVMGLSGIASAAVGGVIAADMPDTLSNVLFAALLLTVAARLMADVRSRAHA
jgi:uncharacterized membrane protein YfcA